MIRPDLTGMVAALRFTDRRWDFIAPTEGEAAVADYLDDVSVEHRSPAVEPDRAGTWGRCTACATPWPCPPWREAQQVGITAIGDAAHRYYLHATRRRTEPQPCP